ncbi:hypothetical protein PSECIP111951_01979 [Pseudoalteromonas holothuriae]|uniref:Membrane protein triplicated sequence n=1 Tax=Pseudoalteromonas holothuriae TaxID=2963714 RepID=A0A9W4QUY6_9GAMM|nr:MULTISPECIES: hypothetical protein [unclassified Pseudoalteromonas]CAH9054377.1 hypothetical protein PSECIP111854_01362 [Pseudoalteromonas sp. CIP111854]CAH9058971.1 hypothetical protein PSECIP111951_01979 [Pseudoalteromonas sp. CIP111951]
MINDTYFFQELPLLFDKVVTFSMILAFAYHAVAKVVLKKVNNLSLIITSGLVTASYAMSSYLYSFNELINLYLLWIIYDAELIFLLWALHKLLKIEHTYSFIYVCLGLVCNSCLYALIYIDRNIVGTNEVWWFWYFYSTAIKVFDALIIIALFTNKDFLKLSVLKQALTKRFGSKKCLVKEQSEPQI